MRRNVKHLTISPSPSSQFHTHVLSIYILQYYELIFILIKKRNKVVRAYRDKEREKDRYIDKMLKKKVAAVQNLRRHIKKLARCACGARRIYRT